MYLPPIISKIFYAVLLAPLLPKQSTLVQFHSSLFRKSSSFDRIMSLVNLVDRAVPGIARSVSRWMYKNNHFPWEPVNTELIAFGSGAAVFRVSWKNGDKALRFYRKSLGRSFRGLIEIADYYKWNYETARSWYGNDLVLPLEFLVLQGLPLIGPVAASLQPYIDGEKLDLFNDFSDEELLGLFSANDDLREQFIRFAGATIRQWDGQKMCYDLVGEDNVMLVKDGGHYKLQIADVGIFKFDLPMKGRAQKMAEIEKRISRLASLYESAKAMEPGLPKVRS